MNTLTLLKRLASGDRSNIAFADFQRLLVDLGFELKRRRGSHHIYLHAQIGEIVNVQEVKGEVKPYQVRQVLKLIERYDLRIRP